MKPRTKLQERVFYLHHSLPELDAKLKHWAFDNIAKHVAHRTKTKTCCLSCGHTYKGSSTAKIEKCPVCDRKLTVVTTAKKKVKQRLFFSVIDTCQEFQLNRVFEMYVYAKAGEAPRVFCWEITQQWIQPEGKDLIVSRIYGGLGRFDTFHGDLEIRRTQDEYGNNKILQQYDIWPDKVYPKMKVLPIYKRNGFKNNFMGLSPYRLFSNILNDQKAETLLKAKQAGLLTAHIANRSYDVRRFWDSIKICIRNKYIVKEGIMYLDYLKLLHYFRKDLHSPKYVCPANLKTEHDKLVIKKTSEEKRRELERKIKKAASEEQAYAEAKAAFIGLVFQSESLTVKVLENVKEFVEEALAHKHCVFSNEYYKKEDSLIFSARIDGTPVETIEISLSSMKIVQARGLGNRPSPYHDQIIELVRKNMLVIKKKHKKTKSIADDTYQSNKIHRVYAY